MNGPPVVRTVVVNQSSGLVFEIVVDEAAASEWEASADKLFRRPAVWRADQLDSRSNRRAKPKAKGVQTSDSSWLTSRERREQLQAARASWLAQWQQASLTTPAVFPPFEEYMNFSNSHQKWVSALE